MKAKLIFQESGSRRLLAGAAMAIATFAALGTVAALWENPFFVRMTPVGGWEISLLALLSFLTGLYVVIRRPLCSNGTVGVGGVLGFLGVACPVCNKILLLAFGSELLLTYFEPVRIYVTALGVLIAAWAVFYEYRRGRPERQVSVCEPEKSDSSQHDLLRSPH